MKKARYSDSQILTILKQAEAGTPDLSVPAETPEGGTPPLCQDRSRLPDVGL